MSAVPVAQEALTALLQAQTDPGEPFEGVFVDFGARTKLPTQNERIYVLENVPSHTRSRPSAFPEDIFELQVLIDVWRSGDDAAAVNARTWQLIDALDALLAAEDFYAYDTEDGEMHTEVAVKAYDDGRLLTATSTISLVSRG